MAKRTDTQKAVIFEKFQRMVTALDDVAKMGKLFIVLSLITGVDDDDCDKMELILKAIEFDDGKLDEAIKGMTKQ